MDKKKKEPTLPNTGLHPMEDKMHILPDAAKGIGKFNASFGDTGSMPSSGGDGAAMGEALEEKSFIDKLPEDVADYLDMYDLMSYERPDGVIILDTYEGDYEFDNLEDFIESIRQEIEQSQEMNFSVSESLEEHLRNLDRECFDEFCESYDLLTMLEDVATSSSQQTQLTQRDKEMLRNAKTAQEASTYLKGLMVKNGKLVEEDEEIYNESEEDEGFPYYVTYYVESPKREPIDGCYYYVIRNINFSKGFDTLDEAREYAKELAGDFGMEQASIDHYYKYSRYIGEGEDIYVELADDYGQMKKGRQVYESLERSSIVKSKSLTEASHRLYQDPWSIESYIDDVRDALDALYSAFNRIIEDRPELEGYINKLSDFDKEVVAPFIEDVEG